MGIKKSAQEVLDESRFLDGIYIRRKDKKKIKRDGFVVLEDCYMVGFDNPLLVIIPKEIKTIQTGEGKCNWFFENGFVLLSKKKFDKEFPIIKKCIIDRY
jgi:hypothetical protein